MVQTSKDGNNLFTSNKLFQKNTKKHVSLCSFLCFNKNMNTTQRRYEIYEKSDIFYESMRIAFFFDMFLIPYAASIYSCPIKRKFDRCVVSIIVILPSFLYWLYFIMYKGGYGTNVFKFR